MMYSLSSIKFKLLIIFLKLKMFLKSIIARMISSYQLLLTFPTLEKMLAFVLNNKEVVEKELVEPKKEDKRGSYTKTLHINTRIYQNKHPKLSYRECLKIVGKKCKEKSSKENMSVFESCSSDSVSSESISSDSDEE